MSGEGTRTGLEVAIVGLAGRFPGAEDVQGFWRNLIAGVSSVVDLSPEDLIARGADPARVADPRWVKAAAEIAGADLFDARFFDVAPREAELLDPQHRLFLEACWSALEDAGIDPSRDRRPIGVFAGSSISTYFFRNVLPSGVDLGALGGLLGADKDHLTTLVSWKLDLSGPSFAVQSACSTSLVAVHVAAQSLLNGECDAALAGGVSIAFPQNEGYAWNEGGIFSRDGRCRSFDERGEGTMFGSGLGVVVLKRLDDALADGDRIRAVIKGSAVTNDAGARLGYTAPSAAGQAKVIRAAQLLAEVEPETIGFVEGHGTATPLGDPIEVAALSETFGRGRRATTALGSVKSNIGHLNAAAGVAGLIKAVLAVEHGEVPPTLHFERPNREIDLASGPFFVNTAPAPFPAREGAPRRAAVSSFGMGGTNAHAILEQAPPPPPSGSSREFSIVALSAKSPAALDAATERLAAHRAEQPDVALADVAFTLALGRKAFAHRRAVVLDGAGDFAAASAGSGSFTASAALADERQVFFLFPGQGAQYLGMGEELYASEPVFRAEIDRAADHLSAGGGMDLRDVIFVRGRSGEERARAEALLSRTEWTQVALFAVETALARLWLSWGVVPAGMIGHSVGELVAAHLAGVFSFDDALSLVALRGRLMQSMPEGAMLAVPRAESWVAGRLAEFPALEIAAVNAPESVVVAGPAAEIERFALAVSGDLPDGLETRLLHTSHAFHTAAMEPILGEFERAVAAIERRVPERPFVSNRTGRPIEPAEATDPAYWAAHLRHAVRFSDGLRSLSELGDAIYLEVGPGNSLGTLARRLPVPGAVLASLRHPKEEIREAERLARAVAELWARGGKLDWRAYFSWEKRRKVALPGYPFERQRFFLEARGGLKILTQGKPSGVPVVGSAPRAAGEAPVGEPGRLHQRPALATAYVAPRNEDERRIAAIWGDLFGVAEVGVHDNFFDLGGHSLLATRVVSRVREASGVELPLDALFSTPTIAALARAVAERRVASEDSASSPTRTSAPSGAAVPAALPGVERPLSFAQERLWLLDRLVPDNAFYTLGSAQRLAQEIDVPALAAALAEVVRRHETLRSSFGEIDGRPRLVVHPSVPVRLPRVALAALPAARRGPESERLAAGELRRPFDLRRAPLARFVLLQVAPSENALVYSFHHIVSDGWSLGVFGRELFAIYPAFAARRPSPLPPLAIGYSEVAIRQRERFARGEIDRQLAYWRERLAGAPITELPADRRRPAEPSHRGVTLRSAVGPEIFLPLARLARRHFGSPFMALLGAFYALVARYAGQDDLVVGAPIAGRSGSGEEPLIGFFVNNLVLRADLSGDPTFDSIVRRTQEIVLDAFSHQEVPFERLVEELSPRRDMSRNPLFQLMFNLLPMGERNEAYEKIGGLLLLRSGAAPFDLQVYLFESSDRVDLGWEYATDLFEGATIERLAGHYRNLLAGAADRPETRLSDLPLLSAEERAELLAASSAAALEARVATVPERFAAQASRTPAAMAVTTASETVDYATLASRVDRLARRLAALGLSAEAKVGIAVGRSAALPVSMLGVLAAGASYVPLDPGLPAERLAYLAADAKLAALIVEGPEAASALAAASVSAAARIELSPGGEALEESPGEPLAAGAGDLPLPLPEQLAYTIYTSGSTGRPKGVELSHGALASFLAAMIERPGVSAGDTFVAVTSPSFDIAGLEIFAPLLVGARVVVARRDEVADGHLLADLLAASGGTILQATPSGWRVLLASGWAGAPRLTALVGGEALPPALAAELRPKVAALWNLYGPTETAVWSTLDEVAEGRISIGRPIPGTRAYVVDAAGEPMPRGIPGELWIGGLGVARGYAGRPDLTAERFLPDPFSGLAGARLYRTGDLARLLPDGRLEALGRTDHQVKIRGHRIELGEIESALADAPGVSAAAATVWGEGEERRIAAYVVLRPGAYEGEGAALPDALASFLRARLPEAYVPSTLTRLDRLPQTPNGKLDRRALPAPGRLLEGVAVSEPRTPSEVSLAGFWRELLGVAAVGPESHFFQLGGHSLLAMRLVARVREEMGVELPLRRVFEAPTLAGLSAAIDGERAGRSKERDLKDGKDLKESKGGEDREKSVAVGVAEVAPVVVARPRLKSGPLSFAQSRLWLLDRLTPGNPFYNLGGGVRLSGPLDRGALHAATREIGRRHDTLRTRFAEADGEAVQVVEPDLPVETAEIDLAALELPRGETELMRLTRAQLALPFDLGRAPLLRSWLLRFGPTEHALVYAMHHIVSDGWSMGLMFGEVARIYSAFLAGRPSPLPPLPIQYADFAVEQRAWFAGGELDRQLSYWRERLAALPASELPTDRPRPPVASHRGRTLASAMPADRVVRLEGLGRERSASTFMVLLAGFQAVVARYVGDGDSVLGTPVANRTRTDVEGLIGFFVNTLVLRTEMAGDPRFSEAIERAKATALGAFAHQDLPFERLVEELAPRRDLSRNPLFQLMFNLVNTPFEGGAAGDLAMAPVDVSAETALVDLQLYLRLQPGGLSIRWEYATDLFEAATIERLARHYENLLAGAALRPEARLSELPLLAASERAELLALGLGAPAGERARGTVPALFAEQALRTPSAAAVVDGEVTLDYATLSARADALARRLVALGLPLEAKVGIAVERSAALPVAVLGVFAAGASYVPLDPGYPADRLAYMAKDAGLAAIVVDAEPSGSAAGSLSALAPIAPITLPLGPGGTLPGEAGPSEAGGTFAPRALPDALAYTIYTSGSTGRPKGVEISHGALANFLAAMIGRPGVSPSDVFVGSTSLSFDIAGLELYAPLLVGATIAIARREEVADGRLLARRLEACGATILQATPSGWRVLLASGWPGDPKLKALVGGEALPPTLSAELRGKVGSLWNMYGPTETAVWSTFDPVVDGTIAIGRPIEATGVYVVDARGNLLPRGVPGELLIGGAGVARGYRGRPDLSAERFLPDPFAGSSGARLYATGDLARFLPDGRLEALGRIDHQVKVRGHRIELQEIEAVLGGHPAVAAAAATVFGEGEDRRIAAYVVERPGASLGEGAALRETLLSYLRGRLPDPMLPSSFSRLDRFPLTPSGKVDRKALPAPDATGGAGETPLTPPRNPIEELLAGIWQQLLGLSAVGIESHFFDLGGHSLLAMRLVSRIREVLGVELPLRRVFEAPDLGRLAAAIEQEGMEHILGGSGALGAAIPPLVPQPRGASAPLSFAQERLWFLEQLEPGTSAYNVSSSVTLEGGLDVLALRGALDEIVRRHETFRTRFAIEGGQPVQIVDEPVPFPFEEVDLSDVAEGDRIERAERLAYEMAHRPFDLSQAPLARALLVRLEDRSYRLTVAMHHLATDGWSNDVILGEIAALYPALRENLPSPLPELPVQYADFSLWQRGWLAGETLDRQLGYWRTALADAPPLLELPLDRPRPAVQRFAGSRERFEVEAPLADALRGLSRARGTTLFMTLLAAFDALLARVAGVTDVVVGTPIAGRNRREIEGLVGFFVNTLALRTDLSGDPSFAELLLRVRGVTLGAYAHQDLPFERIVEDLAPVRSRAHSPVFQVHLVVDAPPASAMAPLPDLVIRPLAQALEISKFDLTLMVADGGAGRPLYAQLRYNVELFEPETIARMGERLRILLSRVSAEPDLPLSEIDLLLPAERRMLLADFSGGAHTKEPSRAEPGHSPAPASGRSAAELFLARAAERPEALAILFEAERTTYGELAERSARLARHLQSMGVGPEVLVGLFLERSPRLVESMLAVWLAGGAYLPLDPTLPAERLGMMIKDAGVPILLSEESLLDELPEHAAWVIDLDAIGPMLDSGPVGDFAPVDPDQLAYVIYTSGSTGRPKGVVVTHRGLENLVRKQGEMFEVEAGAGPEPRVLQFASSGFDASVSEIAVALGNGAALVMAAKAAILPGFELYTLLRDRAISNVTLPPSALAALPADRPLPALRSLVVAGEACPVELAETWSVGRKIVNAYGPTENTVCISMHAFVPGSGRLPLGRPIPGVSAYVLDRRGDLAPLGTPGELVVGGIALARGYLGAPDLTAERFVPDPFSASPGERLYRTGDLVRWSSAGDLEFLGRIDTQVKVRGFRIELSEIERALLAHREVMEAVVVARAEAGGEKRLVAYVVARENAAPDLAELRASLGRTLPEYMIPAAIAVLPELPKSASGKVDRRALPDPREVGAAEREIAGPRNPLETFLVGLFAETLHLDRVGIDENFFELGGNSIAGAMLVNRLQEELGEIVHVVVMFETPTVEGLAGYLAEQYPVALARRFGLVLGGAAASAGPIDERKIAAFEALIPVRKPVRLKDGRRNPAAAFVLSPPRSGSTLFRVMLAGHPLLFAPPELELLPYDDLRERRDDFPGRYNHFLEGAVRAVMELDRSTAEEAEAKLDLWEQEGISMAEVFARLEEAAAPRLLVDKTPGYSLHPSILSRAEEMFDGARYVHLIRHPYGMIRSFEEAKLDQVFFRAEHSFTRRELAELVWLVSHRNILAFLEGIPAERKHAVVFEELLAEPERVLRGVCDFLGIDYQADMAAPYQASEEKKSARMTDGLHSWSRMVGDVKFHEHGRIERGVADRWKNEITEDFLGEPTRDMAEALGFARREAGWLPLGPSGWREGDELPLSFAQESLWFLARLDPDSPAYNVPTALRLRGRLSVPALSVALDGLLARHAALRTRFAERDGRPVQIVEEARPVALGGVDLSRLDGAERESELSRLALIEALRPFDLSRAPLFRATLVRLGGDDHAVLFVMHHIASDGWSSGILAGEIGALYAAALAADAPRLAPLPIQYADYSVWQRAWLAGSTLDAHLAWWREQLAPSSGGGEPPPALALPTDRPRGPEAAKRGATRFWAIPADRLNGLDRLAQEEGATPFILFLAAFGALLSRTTGQTDFAVGTVVANRTRAQVEGLIGVFMNTLALRLDLAGDPSFRELVRRAKGLSLGAFAHQEVPFEKVVSEIQPNRDPGGSPLFQTMLLLQNAPAGALSVPGLALERVAYEKRTSKLDLTLTLVQGAEGLGAQYEFDLDLFDPATMLRLGARFADLLASAAAEPDRPLGTLPAATASELHQTLVEWNDRPAPYDPRICLHRLVEMQVDRTPDALAVIADGAPEGEGELTYAELEARANRLANRLLSLGVRRGARVAVVVERSLDLIVAILGTQKAGAAYVPLDPSYPADRLAYLFEDSKVAAVVAQERFVATLPEEGVRSVPVVRIDDPADLARESVARPEVSSSPDDLAYVIYTSGSTGKPKGVLIPHRAIGNRVQWQIWAHPFEVGERLLQKTPTSFDASVWELFAPLAAGGVLVFAQPDGHRDAAYMAQAIRLHGVGTLQLVPSMLQVFAEEPELARCSTLRRVFAGGEALPTALGRRLSERLGIPLHNLYGPTETAIDVASRSRVAEVGGKTISPIGRPLPNLRLVLLDRERRPVALGLPGELCVGGANLAWGYLGRPDLAAEKFVPDPLAGPFDPAADGFGPGSRLYRTGDLARFLPDGEIEYLGRIDSQVKIRGFRIELGEIESRLRLHPRLAQAAVVARSGGRGDGADQRLVAYVVPAEGSSPEDLPARDLRAFLARELPDPMVPADYVVLAALPTLPNGKLDLAALPAPADPGLARTLGIAAPRTPTEEILANLWAQVLGFEAASVTDSFFDLGGHSLLALQVASRAEAAFGVPVSVRSLFEAPSIEQLARKIEASRAAGAEPPPPLVPISRTGPLPLSFAQERLWFLYLLLPDNPAYNLPIFLRFVGELSLPALARALQEIVRRHESLRTTFERFSDEDSRPVQRIASPDETASLAGIRQVDLIGVPLGRRSGEAERLANREGRRPFDLSVGPLVRATMVRLDTADHVGLFNLHHSVSDDWSSGILVRELVALYAAALAGRPSPLLPLAIQYADYAAWQRRWMDGPALERRLKFWTKALAGAPLALDLPGDRPRPPVQSFRGGNHGLRLTAEIESEVRKFARGASASPFMVLFSAFATLLGRLAGVEDLLVGSPVAGRTRPELEGLIGFFINTLVLRARPRPEATFAGLVGEARGTLLDAFAEQDLPFEKLVSELNPERDPSRPPIFSVNFSFQTAALGRLELPGIEIEPWKGGSGTAKTDLALFLSDQGAGISGALVYSSDLFDRETISRWAEHLETLLGAALADPALPLGELPLLKKAERAQILSVWGRPGPEAAAPLSLAALFEQSADRFGELAAVVLGDRELSYAQLDARANQLAHHLRAFGVGPEVAVGVFCDPSFDLAVGLLGIAKAGGVYVPLDPQLPLERLSYLIEDAGLAILLTQEHLQESLPALPVFAIVLDGAGWEMVAVQPEARPEPLLSAEAALDTLAYVIYTSGSTGRPKGVGVSHRGIANLGSELARFAELEPGDRLLQFASVGFDASISEFAAGWIAGAALVFAGREQRMPGAGLARLLTQQRISLVTLPPSALAAMTEPAPGVPAALIVAGEACPPDLAERWRQGRRFIDAYGPTETTVCATALAYAGGRLTIGRPIAGFEAYVVDPRGEIQPPGVPGELLLGGASLARGYQGRPDLTAERFVPHPFAGTAGARLYRTGDLGRWISVERGGATSFEIEFLGRIDHQVKIRGFRIELGEIETVLGTLAGVREAVVLARPAGDGDLRLVAYVAATEQRPEPADLKEALRDKLPDYMVPGTIAVLDDFPRTAAGKVDRRALAAIDPARAAAEREYLPPQTDVEAVLAEIWCEVLDRERIGIDEDFFEIGGHSLLATKVVARVQKVFRIELELRDFFAATTIEAAARALIAKEKQPGLAARTARLLRQIQGMSAEQRQTLLAGTPAQEGAEEA